MYHYFPENEMTGKKDERRSARGSVVRNITDWEPSTTPTPWWRMGSLQVELFDHTPLLDIKMFGTLEQVPQSSEGL